MPPPRSITNARQPVSRAKSKYEGERNAKVQELVQKLRDSTQETCTKLSDWGLPGAIEVEENPGGVPQSLLDNSRVVIAQGGVQKITNMIQVRVVGERGSWVRGLRVFFLSTMVSSVAALAITFSLAGHASYPGRSLDDHRRVGQDAGH